MYRICVKKHNWLLLICTTWLRYVEHTREHFLLEKTVNQRCKVELFKRKMKLRMDLFIGKGVINWGVKMFRNIVLIGSCQSRKKKFISEWPWFLNYWINSIVGTTAQYRAVHINWKMESLHGEFVPLNWWASQNV